MKVLTPDQQLLARYLAELRMPRIQRLLIITELWEPEATFEMLKYIADTKESNLDTLSRVSAEIARKQPAYYEEGDE